MRYFKHSKPSRIDPDHIYLATIHFKKKLICWKNQPFFDLLPAQVDILFDNLEDLSTYENALFSRHTISDVEVINKYCFNRPKQLVLAL